MESRNGHYLNGELCRRRAAWDAIENHQRRRNLIDLLFMAVGGGRGKEGGRGGGGGELTLVIEFLDVLDELYSN